MVFTFFYYLIIIIIIIIIIINLKKVHINRLMNKHNRESPISFT